MASKRTFGLVSDYGGSDSEEETENIEEEKKASPEKSGRLVETKAEAAGEETETASKRSKWSGVRTEYETSSLMYQYTQDMEDQQQSVTAALAEADKVVQSSKPDPAVEESEHFQQMVAEQLVREKDKATQEQSALDWEIREIQKEIAEERKKWDGVWSDEEGDGAESQAIFQDQQRRNDVLQAVIAEVEKTNKKSEEGDSKLDKYAKKGQGWKRLQMIAESRVNTGDPAKLNQYPAHKFPLKD